MDTIRISLPGGKEACGVVAPKTATYDEILQALDILQRRNLLLVVGGAKHLDEDIKTSLYPLFRDGIAAAAVEAEAMIIDGGTHSGVMEMMGRGATEQGQPLTLLGVAPEGKVRYQPSVQGDESDGKTDLEPHHSYFVLVQGSKWGDETDTMFGLAQVLAQQTHAVTVLTGGGSIAKQEVLHSVRQGWPVIVIAGSGELADEIALWWERSTTSSPWLQGLLRRPPVLSDESLKEIIESGYIYLFKWERGPEELKRLLKFLFLKQEKKTLASILEHESFYATEARSHQRRFKRLQFWILALGVLGTALALTQAQLEKLNILKVGSQWDTVVYLVVVLVPIVMTALLAVVTSLKWGEKWLVLRSCREALKQERHLYRTHTGRYAQDKLHTGSHRGSTAEERLVQREKAITQRLLQSSAIITVPLGRIVLRPPAEGKDDELSDLTTNQYMQYRLIDQLSYYQRRIKELGQKLVLYRWLIIAASALGAFLAAIRLGLWLPLATALGGALGLYLEYTQVVNTLTIYNQTAMSLMQVKDWWNALQDLEKQNPERFHELVETTEKIMESEHQNWAQHMQNALDKLYKKDASTQSSS